MKTSLTPTYILWIISICLVSNGCKKYLDAKSDKKLVIATSIQDAQALLDNYSVFNRGYPSIGAQGDDDFYLLDTYFSSLGVTQSTNHTWKAEAYNPDDWTNLYQRVYNANVALQTLNEIKPSNSELSDWNRAVGTALFLRSYAFFHLAQFYADPFDESTADQKLGIPLRLDTDPNKVSSRSSLAHTWNQIINDLQKAAALLPEPNVPVSRPSKSAAYAALANAYLTMSNFSQARLYADSCLQISNILLDYNSIPNNSNPFPTFNFNPEILFHSVMLGTGMLSAANWRCDTVLFSSYTSDDLRKVVYFRGTGSFGFEGDYGATTGSDNFNGLSTDEIYLIRAECSARMGERDSALADLNKLLVTRWRINTFVPYTANTVEEALTLVLNERRKELVGRGKRWFDLRRLNKEPIFAKELVRKLHGETFTLPANSSRYTHSVPFDVIQLTGIQQNVR